eukprot:c10654_g1_i2.p1 GENE.c10654_g1_i2~~c10654_g1_i2.p1  ORF type:complete len:624 (-),score=140.33 c10654_g1_i2:140-2011(-)
MDFQGGGEPIDEGLCALSRLGNTCFLNSGVQCLSNCRDIAEYFLSHPELNSNLDHLHQDKQVAAQVVISFRDLIQVMWSRKFGFATPERFRSAIGTFAPQFSTDDFQDAMEFISVSLDALHQGLVALPEQFGTSEFVEPNSISPPSIITDLFQGQLKSTLTCSECSHSSVTFDTFTSLSLPVPESSTRRITVTFVSLNPLISPSRIQVDVDKYGTIEDLKLAILPLTEVSPSKILVAELSQSRIFQYFGDEMELHGIHETDVIAAYEMASPVLEAFRNTAKIGDMPNYQDFSYGTSRKMVVPVLLFQNNSKMLSGADRPNFLEAIGPPLLIYIPEYTCPTIRDLVQSITNLLRGVSCENFELRLIDSLVRKFSIQNNSSAAVTTTEIDDAIQIDMYAIDEFGKRREWVHQWRWGDDNLALNIATSVEIYSGMSLVLEMKSAGLLLSTEVLQSVNEIPGNFLASTPLTDCIRNFETSEILAGSNAWHCEKCNRSVEASKHIQLWRQPKILIFHLKRFSFSNGFHNKIESYVDFPLTNLDLSSQFHETPSSGTPAVYNLISVSNHLGTIDGGHYTAFVKHSKTGNWFCFDDSRCQSMLESEIVTESAYILLYRLAEPNGTNNQRA